MSFDYADEYVCVQCQAEVICIVQPSPFRPYCLDCQVDRLQRGVIMDVYDVTPEPAAVPRPEII